MTLNDQGGLDRMNDAMNEGAGTVFYAIGTPVLSLVLLVQGVTAMTGRQGRLFTRDGVAWLGARC